MRRLAVIGLIAALAAGWWFVRAALVYGPTDLLGLARHDAVMGEEPRTAQYVEKLGIGGAAQRFASTLSQSFWAQFGWMSILVDERLYLVLNLLTGFALLGLALAGSRIVREGWAAPPRRTLAFGVLATVALLVVGTVLYYNLRFWQPQGRYLYAAIVPLGALFALGLREVLAERHRVALFALIYGALIALNVVCLRLYIVPFFR